MDATDEDIRRFYMNSTQRYPNTRNADVPLTGRQFIDEDDEDDDEDHVVEDEDEEIEEEFEEDEHPEQLDLLRRDAEMELTVHPHGRPTFVNDSERLRGQRKGQPQASEPDEEETTPVNATRRARRDDIVDRVRTSLFDILGSATRRHVNPQWRPVGPDNNNRESTRNNPDSRANDGNNIETRVTRSRRARVTLPSIHPEGRGGAYGSARHSRKADEEVVESDGEDEGTGRDGNSSVPNRRSQMLASIPKVVFPVAAFLIMLVLIFTLDGYVSERIKLPSMADRTKIDLEPVSSVVVKVFKLLFRNAYPYPKVQNVGLDGGSSSAGSSDVVTRDELKQVLLPELLTAAREVASRAASDAIATAEVERSKLEEANRKVEEERRRKEEEERMQAAITSTLAESRSEQERFIQFAERYAADKDLPPDFALGSAGGAVIATEPSTVLLWTRFARAYAAALVSERTFTPTWPRPASVVLQPDVLPGNCWAFDGDRGTITIRLARPVRVSAITVEHTPRTSVFSVSSALRMFRVIGVPIGPEAAEFPLHNNMLIFDLSKDSSRHLQTFEFGRGDDDGEDDGNELMNKQDVLRAVRFEILSNHGSNFTAVYRIRVHGEEQVKAFDGVDGGEL